MKRETREIVSAAEALGFRFKGYTGSGHCQVEHPNGVVTFPSTASDWRAVRNITAELERVSGRKLPRVNSGRSRKAFRPSGFSIEAARKDAAAWGAREQVEELHAEHAAAVDEMTALIAQGDRAAAQQAKRVLTRIRDLEEQLAAMHQPFTPFAA